MKEDNVYGSAPFANLKYCTRCCMPSTQEGQILDELGICQACRSSEQKIHIDWSAREKKLREILENAKATSGDNYDCILPLSGGKDSMFQAYVLTQVYGLRPLGITASHNWYSETGWYNLFNLLEQFDIDHVMYTPNRGLVNKLAKKSLGKIGDTCWHCHSGAMPFVLKMAIAYKVPLIVWGESIAENSGRASYYDPVHKFDKDYFLKVSGKVPTEGMVGEGITRKDLTNYYLPSDEDFNKSKIQGIYLGDFMFWDDERQTEFVKEHWGFRETEMEGTYKGFKSVECIMAGMHDFTCYLKRGYGRATFQASIDVRNGLLTREEGFELAKKYDREVPGALQYYLKTTGMTEEEFYKTMKNVRQVKLQEIDMPMVSEDKKEFFDELKKKQFEGLKKMEIPVVKKTRENKEVLTPFVEQLLAKYRDRKDPREVGETINEK